jgi:hypothetical protein
VRRRHFFQPAKAIASFGDWHGAVSANRIAKFAWPRMPAILYTATNNHFMNQYLPLGKFSFGMGDRFGHQGNAQIATCVKATELGAEFIPVWNKSNREHTFIGTEPASLRAEADHAVAALG